MSFINIQDKPFTSVYTELKRSVQDKPFLKVLRPEIISHSKKFINYDLKTHHWRWKRHGQILVLTLIILFFMSAISLVLFTRVGNYVRFGGRSANTDKASALADAGVDYATWKLTTIPNWNGTGGLMNFATGQFDVTVSSLPSGNRLVTSTGYYPSSSIKLAARKVQVELKPIPDETFSVNWAVKSLNTDVNLKSTGITGSVSSHRDIVNPASGYDSNIVGDAYAGTIPSSVHCVYGGVCHPSSPGDSSPQFTTTDITNWTDRADALGTLATCPCVINSNGPYNPTPGGKFPGDVTIGPGGGVSLQGPLHIVGNLVIDGASAPSPASIFLDPLIQPEGTFIIVDGFITLKGGGSIRSNGGSGYGYLAVISKSTLSGSTCAANQSAINIMAGTNHIAVFQAASGIIWMCNDAKILKGALIANQVRLDDTTGGNYVTYNPELKSAGFNYNTTIKWAPNRGSYKIIN